MPQHRLSPAIERRTLARFEDVMTTTRSLAHERGTLWPSAAALMTAGAIALLATASAAAAQQSYQTPEDAAAALINAVRADDQNAELAVLGPDGDDIVSSGDKVADDAIRQRFLQSYDAKHQVTMNGDSKAHSGDRQRRVSVSDPAGPQGRQMVIRYLGGSPRDPLPADRPQ
jgi:hypothetical protein